MTNTQIINRPLTPEETDQVNTGFDNLTIEAGIALESTKRISFVALKEGRLIGCATGLAHKNGDNYNGWFHLTDLFVEKEYRNQGLGAELLNELEDKIKAAGIKNIWLWTSGSATIRFYNRHGYTQFTEMENWYSDGSGRVGFRKRIG